MLGWLLQRTACQPCLPALHVQVKSDTRYCFVVEWYDPLASLVRQYQLIYYTADGTVEMVRTSRRPGCGCGAPHPSAGAL